MSASLLHPEARQFPEPGRPEPAVRKSSFYLGLRLLPHAERRAMFAIYDFCRAVDDIADGAGTSEQRLDQLARWRRTVDGLYAGEHAPPALAELQEAIRRFALEQADFHAVIDGMAMDSGADDAQAQGSAPDWQTLDRYCDRVASAPGRLSVRVFGLPHEAGLRLAHHLGRALQLTNILRDIDEDAGMDRLYLPREALAAAGIATRRLDEILADPQLTAACAAVAGEARRHFTEAERVMDACARNAVRTPRLMVAAYRPLLDRLLARGWAPPRRPVSKSKRRLLAAVLRYGLL